MTNGIAPRERDRFFAYILLGLAATALALASARPFTGSWNDGSRLATVEALVDQHTLAIDESVFVKVPRRADGTSDQPGTKDKLLIDGHYYSDKPPVLQLWLAGCYQVWQWCGGPGVRERHGLFCWLMTALSSGLAYVVAVLCTFRLGWRIGLPSTWRWLWTGSFALAAVALPYARHVNGHLPQLAVTAALFVQLAWLVPADGSRPAPARWRLGLLGSLAGLAYTLDLGVGPVLLLCLAPLLLFRCRRLDLLGCVVLGALPWLALHHAINYAVAGTWRPANQVMEYLQWPGSPFSAENATGTWKHSMPSFLSYTAALWLGDRGFLNHNLVFFLALPALALLRDRACPWRPELLFGIAWAVGCGLLFGMLSNNYSGWSLSIRWFVPLLVPGYLLAGVLLRQSPALRGLFLVLSFWGGGLALLMWRAGPFTEDPVRFFWPVQLGALLSVLGWGLWYGWHQLPGRHRAIVAPSR